MAETAVGNITMLLCKLIISLHTQDSISKTKWQKGLKFNLTFSFDTDFSLTSAFLLLTIMAC